MYEGVRVALDPTPLQERRLMSHVGAARFAYNSTLAYVKECLDSGEKISWTSYSLRNHWNQVKRSLAVDSDGNEWWQENSKEAYNHGISVLADGLSNWSKSRKGKRRGRRIGFPRFRSKNDSRQSFSYTTGSFGTIDGDDHHVRMPRIGVVHCFEDVLSRVGGAKVKRMTVSLSGGRWFASLLVERPDVPFQPNGGPSVGVDLGVKTLVTLSDGTTYANPHTVGKCERRRRRIQRRLARKTKGSKRRERCRMRLARAYAHERNTRRDYLDKMTTEIAKRYGMVCIEDLNVSGMVKNHRIAKHIEDASFSTIRLMLEYKCPKYGSELRVIDRYFPSSKRCSNCGLVKAKLGLGERTFACERCGLEVDRDLNAAINILVAGSAPETLNAHGADVRPDVDDGGLTAVKCEPSVRPPDDARLGAGLRKEVM